MPPKLDNKFIHARQTENAFKRPVYDIINNTMGNTIAQIGWYPKWGRYVMFPLEETVWDIGCLSAIVKFIQELK